MKSVTVIFVSRQMVLTESTRMFRRFICLQWKAFTRSSSFGKSLGIKIFLGIMSLIAVVYMAVLGGFLYTILRKVFPEQGAIWMLSHFLIYWVGTELFGRYFLQKLPVLDIKPLLINNIPKNKIAHYTLGRAVFSAFNLLATAIFLPFALVLLYKGYPWVNVSAWFFSMLFISLILNYLNFLISKSNLVLGLVLVLLIVLSLFNYFNILDSSSAFAPIFNALYEHPQTILCTLGLLFTIYGLNYYNLRRKLYLDGAFRGDVVDAKAINMSWARHFGQLTPMLKLDLRMIWRNKRTKTQVFISLLFALYGLFFYTQEIYADKVAVHAFLGIFMTGIFLSNFGQFVPAWDSTYYNMIMTQNISIRNYLESKALVISISIVVMFLATIPYVYFGWKVLLVNLACALYNLGVNIPVILYFGSFNKKRIELDKSPLGNMQGVSAVQFLMMLPVLGVPIGLFTLLSSLLSIEVALTTFVVLGLSGLLLKKYLFQSLSNRYIIKKHIMLQGFKQKDF